MSDPGEPHDQSVTAWIGNLKDGQMGISLRSVERKLKVIRDIGSSMIEHRGDQES